VTNSIRLLSLPAEVQKAIVLGKISEGHGRAILMAKPEAQKSLFQSIIKNNLSVRQVEEKARKIGFREQAIF